MKKAVTVVGYVVLASIALNLVCGGVSAAMRANHRRQNSTAN